MAERPKYTPIEEVKDFTKITDINSPVLSNALEGFLSEGAKPTIIRKRNFRNNPRRG